MDALFTPSSPVHFFDPDRHVILCGLHGFPDRSTKHRRSVTCPACVERLSDRRGQEQHVDHVASATHH